MSSDPQGSQLGQYWGGGELTCEPGDVKTPGWSSCLWVWGGGRILEHRIYSQVQMQTKILFLFVCLFAFWSISFISQGVSPSIFLPSTPPLLGASKLSTSPGLFSLSPLPNKSVMNCP